MKNMERNWKLGLLTLSAGALLAACGEDMPEVEQGGGYADIEEESGLDVSLDETDDSTLFIGMTNAPDSFNLIHFIVQL